jgi:hypothetical protein
MTKAKIETIAEKLGWTVTWDKNEDGTKFVTFSKYSPEGQDFYFEVEYSNLDEIWNKVFEYYKTYDPSYEAYLWLDSEGHGKNGAPYEMIDVYNDMKDCESMILQLYQALEGSE